MKSKNIVILGGGVGGIVAANELRRKLPLSYGITIVEKEKEHFFAASFMWVMNGDRTMDEVRKPFRNLIRKGIDVVHGTVREIDPHNNKVVTNDGELSYDYLIVALGAELVIGSIPGLAESAYTFYSLEGADRLNRALREFNGGIIAIVVSSLPYKCPGALPEGAMLIADYFKKHKTENHVDIQLFTPESQPMPVAGPLLGDSLRMLLEKKGISYHPKHKLTSVDYNRKTLVFEENEPVKYDMLIAIPPHQAPQLLRKAGLANDAGWVPVDRTTLKTKFENIYAIGDVTSINIPGRWDPNIPLLLPKAGVFAHFHAEVVAHQIINAINGEASKRGFTGGGYCMIESGGGRAGFASGEFYAEPSPRLRLGNVSRIWHWGKILFEKWWLSSLGIRKRLLGLIIKIGGTVLRIPVGF
ncbi:MAG: hypothetical protein A2W19_04500 [Spirochaetes bacterium RBG_16_49_21]|nr:MAG: hypothetical protein A2W19_04500 [Spirochaetes bacterium RBG_16_49_21]